MAGKYSANLAKSIRNANASNPERSLTHIWNRLNDRFANPEVVESYIMRKLARFPKLGNKDYAKLYELLDFVTEIEYVKENPTLTIFVYP